MRKLSVFIQRNFKIISILITILLIVPGIALYIDNDRYLLIHPESITWSQDGTKIAFGGELSTQSNLGEIIVWSKKGNTFETIGKVTTKIWDGCDRHKTAQCINLYNTIFSDRFYFSFSPDNQLFSVIFLDRSSRISNIDILVYNLTSKTLVTHNNQGLFIDTGWYPKLVWINGSLKFADLDKVLDVFANTSMIDYGLFDPIATPILSNDGLKVAMTVNHDNSSSDLSYDLIIIDLFSKKVTHNISTNDNLYSFPLDWSTDNSNLLISKNHPYNVQNEVNYKFNYSIYNLEQKMITYSTNETENEILKSWTPDFKTFVFRDLNTHEYVLIYPDSNKNLSFQLNGEDRFYINPLDDEVFNGDRYHFKISKIPSLDVITSHRFFEFNRNLGLSMAILGIIIFVAVIVIRKRPF